MKQKTPRRHTPEYKGQTLGLLRMGQPVAQVAREFGHGDDLRALKGRADKMAKILPCP